MSEQDSNTKTILEEIRAALKVYGWRVNIYISPDTVHELAIALWQRLQPTDSPSIQRARELFNIPKHETKTVEEIEQEILLYSPNLYGQPVIITDTVTRFRVGEADGTGAFKPVEGKAE